MELCPAIAEMIGKPKAILDGKYEIYHTIGRGQFSKYSFLSQIELNLEKY